MLSHCCFDCPQNLKSFFFILLKGNLLKKNPIWAFAWISEIQGWMFIIVTIATFVNCLALGYLSFASPSCKCPSTIHLYHQSICLHPWSSIPFYGLVKVCCAIPLAKHMVHCHCHRLHLVPNHPPLLLVSHWAHQICRKNTPVCMCETWARPHRTSAKEDGMSWTDGFENFKIVDFQEKYPIIFMFVCRRFYVQERVCEFLYICAKFSLSECARVFMDM